jgi:hypothetical protein
LRSFEALEHSRSWVRISFTPDTSDRLTIAAVVHDLEAKNPNIFGPYGGNSRLSSLSELPFNIGMIAGPLLSGSVSETLGYYWMNTVLGEFAILLV